MVRHVNETRHAHVVTIEDPIEFVHEPKQCLIIQREIGTDTESFRDAVDAALRQDPDVIVIGGIRDGATAMTALEAAETGHLVIAAIHTPDAVATIQRYVGLFDARAHDAIRARLAGALQAVVSLRLVPAHDGRHRVPAVEVMRTTPAIREVIRHADRIGELPGLIEKGRESHGMQLFDHHLRELVKGGLISIEAAARSASNPEQLERSMHLE
jgi:twitching motility protein PilT